MAYKIDAECIRCEACDSKCPTQAIRKANPIFIIDPDKCTECVGSYERSKCYEVCPVWAAQRDPAHRESRAQLLAKFKKLHPGETPKTT